MDFKGITWARDIYEKFEAMCLEVEEVMYEDTIKYVENQAQKVGVSVKKLYAEIMQDLLSPSCLVAELPPVPYTPTDINEKPKPAVSDNHGELNDKRSGVEDICKSTAEDSTSPSVLVENARSEECFRKTKRAGLTRRSIGIKRISHPPKVSLCDTRRNCSGDLNVTTSSEFFARHDPSEAATGNRPISDAPAEPCSSAEFVKQEKHNSECTRPASVEESPLMRSNDAAECNSSCHGFPPAPIDILRRDGSLTQIDSNITDAREVGSEVDEAIASYEDHFDIKVIEPDNFLEKSKLEESCIFVEGDELRFVSRGSKKHKSYKKKIYDVLSLKLRPTKKQDLCVSDHDDSSDRNNAGVTSSALAMDSGERKLPAHTSCDFGWELL